MRVIIAGCREFEDYSHLVDVMAFFAELIGERGAATIEEVVSGGADGADKLGERWAKACLVPVKQFLALWETYGRAAGPIRNAEMAEYADALVAFWDGESKGTRDMINKMLDKGKSVHVEIVSNGR